MTQTRTQQVACLGWGSLVWEPKELPIRGEWFKDGPLLAIELARISDKSKRDEGGRVTFVLYDRAAMVRSLWTLLTATDLETAKKHLSVREGMPDTEHIGFWSADEESNGVEVKSIASWAKGIGVDAVVWTDLKASPCWDGKSVAELGKAVLEHVHSLSHEWERMAEQYIRRAPRQTDTEVRRLLESELGWLPI